MVKLTSQQLKDYLIELWLSNKELTDSDRTFYENEISKLVEDLYNSELITVKPLNEQETIAIRKRYGCYDNGVKQTYFEVGKVLNVTGSRIGQILYKAHSAMLSRIFVISKEDILEDNKMTSLDLNADKEILKRKNLGELKLNPTAYSTLKRLGIYTLGGLVSFSLSELKTFVGTKSLNEITEKVHSLGVVFIDELTIKQKREIIALSNHDKIMNSSINWIDLPSGISSMLKDDCYINTLGRLSEQIANGNIRMSHSIVDNAKIIGLNFNERWIKKEKAYKMNSPIQEMLDTTVVELHDEGYLDARSRNALARVGILTIKDIISKSTADIKNIRNSGVKTANSIIDTMHEFGLVFKDEAYVMKKYADCIVDGLKEEVITSRKMQYVQRREPLVEKYHQLVRERKYLNDQSMNLDKKIEEAIELTKIKIKVKKI